MSVPDRTGQSWEIELGEQRVAFAVVGPPVHHHALVGTHPVAILENDFGGLRPGARTELLEGAGNRTWESRADMRRLG